MQVSAEGARGLMRSPITHFSFVLLAFCGCDHGPDLLPVTGTVTLDGQPLSGASVMFAPSDKGLLPAYASTDSKGKFALATGNGVGAMVGRYGVGIGLQRSASAPADAEGLPDGPPRAGNLNSQWITPEKYTVPSTSGLTAEVTSAKLQFEFGLSSTP